MIRDAKAGSRKAASAQIRKIGDESGNLDANPSFRERTGKMVSESRNAKKKSSSSERFPRKKLPAETSTVLWHTFDFLYNVLGE